MSRHPCPNANEDCPLYNSESGCYADIHHEYWPRSNYRTSLEKRFRQHFTELICREVHDELHSLPPPNKPSVEQMRIALEQGKIQDVA